MLTKLFYAHFGFMFCLFLSRCVVVVGREGGRKFFIKNLLNNFFRKLPICSHFVGNKAKGCFKKTNHAKFSEKQTFLTPWYAHVCGHIRGKKCSFFGKFGVVCFLETHVLRFALSPYYRRFAIC